MPELVHLIKKLNPPESFSESPLKGVRIFTSHKPISRTPLLYDPGICIIAQGRKIGYLGDNVFQYDADNYLVVSVSLPFECETFATPEDPLLGLYIDINIPELHKLISLVKAPSSPLDTRKQESINAVGPAPLDEAMRSAVIRLLTAFQSEDDTKILGPALVREILYRALQGSQAPILYGLGIPNSNFSRVAFALQLIQSEYTVKLDVERLADEAQMSVSAFHRAFKEVTSESPMQYLKKVRLTKARDLIVRDGVKTYIAAGKVGYESTSQFSREFKRYFGQTPTTMSREMRSDWDY